jgi:hypothetical protein
MKDEFDIYTKDMFDEKPQKKVSKPDMNMTARINDLQAKLDKGTPITKDQHTLLQKYGRGSVSTGPSGSGASLEKGMMGGRFKPTLHAKGGMVSSASKRADGCCIKGKTKGKMI